MQLQTQNTQMTEVEAPEEEDEYESKKRSALPDLGKRRGGSINVEEVDTPANAENEWDNSGGKF